MKNAARIVGIDLGTTNSAVAHLALSGNPETITNAEGDSTTPSAVLFDGPDTIVGKEALRALHSEAHHVAFCAKRDVGFKKIHKTINQISYPPEVIQAFVLKKLRDDVTEKLGRCEQAVITVPAYFDDARRKATQDAGYIAGLKVVDIINEPTAAALAVGVQRGFLSAGGESARPQTMLVYDLGGGTFDVTVITVEGSQLTTLAIDGDVRLGGHDWDECLVDHVAEAFARQHRFDPRTDPTLAGRLWRECEASKRTLSARRKATITCDFRGNSLAVDVTRERFEELTSHLLGRTESTTRDVLKAADLTWGKIDRVLQVGGSCRMPMVSAMLEKISGKRPDIYPSPDEVVAHGAAIHAGLLQSKHSGRPPQFTVRQVNARSLGVVARNPKSGEDQNAIILKRNNLLPANVKRTFRTLRDRQESVLVSIVEGESDQPEDCAKLGKCVVRPLPPNLPAGTPIEVSFDYSTNSRLRVQVRVNGSDCTLNHEIFRENGLTSEMREHWRTIVADQ